MRVARVHSEPEIKALTGRARERAFHRLFFADLLDVLRLFGFSGKDAEHAATLMTAHTSAETGAGLGIFNNNPGNIHFTPGAVWTSDWYDGTDHDEKAAAYDVRFAAYPTRAAGLFAKCAIVLRSPARRDVLLNGPAEDYFLVLKRTGYLQNPCGQVLPCPDDYVRSMTRARIAAIEADTADLRGVSLVGLGLAGVIVAGLVGASLGLLELPAALRV